MGEGPEIDVVVGLEEGDIREVSSLYYRLQLNRNSPSRLEWWEALTEELCRTFNLRIAVLDGGLVGPEEFLAVVRRAQAWRFFADQFGWPGPAEDDAG